MREWQRSQFKILYSEEVIKKRLAELAGEIAKDYQATKELVVIAMLRGSVYFLADLTRALNVPLRFDFISVGHAEPNNKASHICVQKDICIDIENKDVLVLEEIVRTGLTTNLMVEHLLAKKPKSLNLVALMASEMQLLIDLPLKYIGFEIDYTRVMGYGMDYHDKARNLPFICELDSSNLG